jgi:hypothetical protein
MSVRVNLTPYFCDIVDRKETLEANGDTVGEVIDDIDKRYPGFKKECIDNQGKPYGFLEIYVNPETAFPDESNPKCRE